MFVRLLLLFCLCYSKVIILSVCYLSLKNNKKQSQYIIFDIQKIDSINRDHIKQLPLYISKQSGKLRTEH